MNTSERLHLAKKKHRDAQTELRARQAVKAEEEATHQIEIELLRLNMTEAEKRAITDRGERQFDAWCLERGYEVL